MAPKVTDTKTLYECLQRFDEAGIFKGAHAKYIDRLFIDGVLRSETIGNAVPLTEADLSEIMSEAQVNAMAEATRLLAENAELTAQTSQANGRAETAEAAASVAEEARGEFQIANLALSGQISAAQNEIAAQAAALQTAQARIAELEAALESIVEPDNQWKSDE